MGSGLFIERLLPLNRLTKLVRCKDVETAAEFGSEKRRQEYLMWRHIVYRELGDADITYAPSGAPIITNKPYHIGVSHCKGYAAVCISDSPCAVDIEEISRDFSHAASRFATPDELRLSDSHLLPAALWCAKETLYKYSGQIGLDLQKDIMICSVDFDTGRITGRISDGADIHIRTIVSDGILAAYIF